LQPIWILDSVIHYIANANFLHLREKPAPNLAIHFRILFAGVADQNEFAVGESGDDLADLRDFLLE